jgi:hypothetical protein
MTDPEATIEAYDELAAMARARAHELKRRWWRGLCSTDERARWEALVAKADASALGYQVEAARLRVMLRSRRSGADASSDDAPKPGA